MADNSETVHSVPTWNQMSNSNPSWNKSVSIMVFLNIGSRSRHRESGEKREMFQGCDHATTTTIVIRMISATIGQ